ncbi:kelch repeat protein-like protein [Amniculicola lignicola CBS 123094]|uniref:Kelch repeat protein-like protein n=1 Tax=Amniculicola lignicola CBS 123094 TaxID=1392246 RepID=A0A6A5X460_9PLEO|nr:kelch repeat protein-like protein [Amniculicola lignicola CBS 123094]
MDSTQYEQPVEAPIRRKSVFMEVGLVDENILRRERNPAPILIQNSSPRRVRPSRTVRFRSKNDVFEVKDEKESEWESASDSDEEVLATINLHTTQNVMRYSRLYRLGLVTMVLALMLPLLQTNALFPLGVKGGVIPRETIGSDLGVVKREDSNTDVCKRWAHQSTIVNGTLYIYGGRSNTDPKQTSNTWNNDFITLDLTKSWQISNPSLTGLPRPSGPPKVALGYLWNSFDTLYLYGGQFSDTPPDYPTEMSLWEYNILSKTWSEHKDPKTSAGNNSVDENQPISRAAEGSGFGVATLGRGWYFGGHIDQWTTKDWYTTEYVRVYLKSMVEYTFPGWPNKEIDSLSEGKTAGDEGVWRNITEGGLQDKAGFPERADGALAYIPGFGEDGILIGLSGGTNDTFTQMNIIDIYDIAHSSWYKQSTSGKMPEYRVNPCITVAAAADGSSYNVYMFGGQNLQPAAQQIQYDDMWILSVPSFTWISVNMTEQSVPYGRAGHTCHVWDGQMIVVGGYVGQELTCDSPGIYVFNMSSLSWSDQFTALTGESALKAWSGNDDDSGNPLAQQKNQRGFDSKAGLEGSYGYNVPAAVQSVIGGKETGGATLTAPIQTPTQGPLLTGKPQTYTVTTGPGGAIITEAATPGSGKGGRDGPNIGAIVAGVVAGVFAVIAAYFAFCAWVYRKQVKVWKQHASMMAAQRNSIEKGANDPWAAAGATISSSAKVSSERMGRDQLGSSAGNSGVQDGLMRESNDNAYQGAGGVAGGGSLGRRSSDSSSTEDLLRGQEPSFVGVLLNPRRSLRVINRD